MLFCEKKKYRNYLNPAGCSVCDKLESCKAFRKYYKKNKKEYITFVLQTIKKFPEKYTLEVVFMAERKKFVEIVDKKTGNIEKIVDLKELENLPGEEKLYLTKGKILYVVTHVIEPVLKIEMKKQRIKEEVDYQKEEKKNNAKKTPKKKKK